jgi:ABC-type Fe3+-hydroxamate transport system substrate-binding protein
MINEVKVDLKKHMNKIRKSIQYLKKKISNMEEQFSIDAEILKNKKQPQKLLVEIRSSINQIQDTVEDIINILDQEKERISVIEGNVHEILHPK